MSKKTLPKGRRAIDDFLADSDDNDDEAVDQEKEEEESDDPDDDEEVEFDDADFEVHRK